MPLAIALILLVVGSLLFHFLSPWTFTPLASNWGMIDFTVDITFVVTGLVFVAVNLFMAYAIIRFRHKKGARAKYEPENKKLEFWLTVGTTIGVAAMLAPDGKLNVHGIFNELRAPDCPARCQHCGDTDRRKNGEPDFEFLVFRFVLCSCAFFVAKANNRVGHEQVNGDKNDSCHDKSDIDCGVDHAPI